MNLALSFAVMGLVVAVVRFWEEYYAGPRTRSAVQESVIGWFVFVDNVRIPDMVGMALSPLRTKRGIVAAAAASVVFGFSLSLFPAAVVYLEGDANIVPGFVSISAWDMATGAFKVFFQATAIVWLVVPATLASLVAAAHARSILRRWWWLAISFVIPLIALVAMWIRSGGLETLTIPISPQHLTLVASVVAMTPASTVLAVVAGIGLTRMFVRAVQAASLHLFDKATTPNKSPLTFGCALIGLCIVTIQTLTAVAGALGSSE